MIIYAQKGKNSTNHELTLDLELPSCITLSENPRRRSLWCFVVWWCWWGRCDAMLLPLKLLELFFLSEQLEATPNLFTIFISFFNIFTVHSMETGWWDDFSFSFPFHYIPSAHSQKLGKFTRQVVASSSSLDQNIFWREIEFFTFLSIFSL